MVRAWTVTVLSVLMAALAAQAAFGCSCTQDTDPREDLDDADAAIFGEVLERTVHDRTARYRVRVLERYKGDVGPEVVIEDPYDLACGTMAQVGEQTGLLLNRDADGAWTAGSCSRRTREHLEAGANASAPAPASPGPARLLAGGDFGPERIAALDSRGRLVGLGSGDGELTHLAACPGGRTVIEAVRARGGSFSVAVRDVASMEVRRTTRLELFEVADDGNDEGLSDEQPTDLRCTSANGSLALVALVGRRDGARLVVVAGGAQRTVWRSKGQAGRLLLGRRHAWVQAPTRLLRIALRDGRVRDLGPRPPLENLSGVSPDDRRLVVTAGGRGDYVHLLDARTGRVTRSRTLAYVGNAYWLGRRGIALHAVGGLVFVDARLRTRRRAPDGQLLVVEGRRLRVVREGRLHTYDRSGRAVGAPQPLFSRHLRTLAVVPRRARVARAARACRWSGVRPATI